MGELAFMKVPHWLIQLFQEGQTFRRNPGHDDSAIVFLPLACNQSALFHAVKEARHVRIARNHALADAATQHADRFCTAQNPQYVVLSHRQVVRFDELLGFLGQGIGGSEDCNKKPILVQNFPTGLFFTRRFHSGDISCYNNYCQEESYGPDNPSL